MFCTTVARVIMSKERLAEFMQKRKEKDNTRARNVEPQRTWRNFRMNERTFVLCMMTFSLSIVLGKLYINHGPVSRLLVRSVTNGQNFPALSSMYDIFGNPQKSLSFDDQQIKAVGEKLMNVSREYGDVIAHAVVAVTNNYSWLFKALLSGLSMIAFSSFIIYKDSDVPGENPPSPFSPRKQRYAGASRLQMNYLIGVLNGILIIVYMSL